MEHNLTQESDVVKHMKQAANESDWNRRCDEVKDANGGDYPSFWFKAIILSGVASQTAMQWGRLN